jgi:hypothetical protein
MKRKNGCKEEEKKRGREKKNRKRDGGKDKEGLG